MVTLTITKPTMTLTSTTDEGTLTTIVEYNETQCKITTKNDMGERSVIVKNHDMLTSILDQRNCVTSYTHKNLYEYHS